MSVQDREGAVSSVDERGRTTSVVTRTLKPVSPWWSSQARSAFRVGQLQQYAARVRPFLVAGTILLPLGGMFDFLVTHAARPLGARVYPLALSLVLAAICAGGTLALGRARDARHVAIIARWIDALLTGLFAFYLSDRVVGVGGTYAHVTAAGSLMAVLFVRTLVMPLTWWRAATTGVLVWLAYPLAWLAHSWVSGESGAPLGELDGVLLGTVLLFFAVSVTVSALGSELLLRLRRTQFQAGEARRYHIEAKLGGGGMGDVYLARHGTLKTHCAVKVCRLPDEGIGDETLRRFELEAQYVSGLKHPNVVRIFDYGQMEDGSVYYAMEHLPGIDLGAFLREEGPVPESRVLHWAEQILRALGEAHSRGILHRDLKPANLFLTYLGGEPDFIKVLDFGLVKLIEGKGDGSERITRVNALTGTPLYMSPEQAQGADELDQRSDLYSLGVVLYELLGGEPPFFGPDQMSVLVQHVTKPPRPLRDIAPDASAEVESVVHKLLAKEPRDRFADARSVELALRKSPRYGTWSRDEALAWWGEHTSILDAPRPSESVTTRALAKT